MIVPVLLSAERIGILRVRCVIHLARKMCSSLLQYRWKVQGVTNLPNSRVIPRQLGWEMYSPISPVANPTEYVTWTCSRYNVPDPLSSWALATPAVRVVNRNYIDDLLHGLVRF
jgi:hypothetical protein